MGFYSRVIFPYVCDLTLNRPFVAEQRKKLLAGVHGEILEIGFGTGLNLPHYPQSVQKITTVDPITGVNRLAEKRIRQSAIAVSHQRLRAERLPFVDASFDCVVSTFTLCSISDVSRAIAEAYRVLRTNGQFVFLEHGLSPESKVQKWQRRLNRIQMLIGDGCHLIRDMRALIVGQPFRSVECEEFYLDKTPKTHGYLFRGSAFK